MVEGFYLPVGGVGENIGRQNGAVAVADNSVGVGEVRTGRSYKFVVEDVIVRVPEEVYAAAANYCSVGWADARHVPWCGELVSDADKDGGVIGASVVQSQRVGYGHTLAECEREILVSAECLTVGRPLVLSHGAGVGDDTRVQQIDWHAGAYGYEAEIGVRCFLDIDGERTVIQTRVVRCHFNPYVVRASRCETVAEVFRCQRICGIDNPQI